MSWRTAYNTAYLVSLPLVASPKLLPSVATSDMLGPLAAICSLGIELHEIHF